MEFYLDHYRQKQPFLKFNLEMILKVNECRQKKLYHVVSNVQNYWQFFSTELYFAYYVQKQQ